MAFLCGLAVGDAILVERAATCELTERDYLGWGPDDVGTSSTGYVSGRGAISV